MTQESTEQAGSQQQAFAAVAEESAKIEHDKDNPPRFFTMKLPVELSDEERANEGADLEKDLAALDDLDDEKKDWVADWKERKGAVQARVNARRPIVRDGKREAEVECREDKAFGTNTATITRLDTGETVQSRPLTYNERQASLPGIPAPEPSEDDVAAEDGEEEASDDSAQTSFDHSPKEDDDVPEEDEDEFADERPQITNPEEVLGESPAAKRARGKRS